VRARRVALIADVHGNAVALAAVLRDLEREQPDCVVHCGDLTWGPMPGETAALVDGLGMLFVRGNADRAVSEAADRLRDPVSQVTPRERWLVAQHSPALRGWLAAFPARVELTVDGLGDVLCCHGSPRSDEELITVATPESRLAEAIEGVAADVVVTAHTHVGFERSCLGRTFINPGSVGMPYEEVPGAYWALLGPGIEHRRTEYDIDEAERCYRESGDPLADEMVEVLRHPPTPAEVIAHAESLAFSG
jgi:putative phosphoesterase